ncbi:MAG TPA: hypothetical protein VJZ49_08965 [Syntrophales bacterium]|nr:hypothetical protein [Syntrophales bacterium]
MKLKSSYLVTLMFLFLVVVFLDQNRTAVPIKILIGNPFQLELSLIIVISMVVGVISAIGIFYLMNRKK